MPRRSDIKKILIIGSGPIVIGQACEFDYSGTQACKALKEDGYEVILINSNPATIMTDPETADRTYIEPITPEIVSMVIEAERPDALLPTLGGQTGLNTAVSLSEMGTLDKFGVEMIGASVKVIRKAEDRRLFRDAMQNIGLRVPRSGIVRDMKEAHDLAAKIGYPVIIRPSFTLGGTGGGAAYNSEDLEKWAAWGLDASLIDQIMIEESIIGWKEFELEVMRDKKDNVVIICSIENLDPMGVHTGDSITVAPAQTLSDREYQKMRDATISIMREIGVETGGSNVQFAVNPKNGELMVIEMNPRVSRSSALASKATGFPIAKIAAKLAAGYTLDEIPNDITKETFASFEPALDYCVVKIPRWTFEKFPGTADFLTTAMKSVGETMAIGRTFREALQKALRSLEIGRFGLGADGKGDFDATGRRPTSDEIRLKLSTPNSKRIFYIRHALNQGMDIEKIYNLTGIDPWFLYQIKRITDMEAEIAGAGFPPGADLLRKSKESGFSDVQLAHLLKKKEGAIRELRKNAKIECTYKLVDTCAAEFEAYTPYFYSTYEKENEARITKKKKVMILGGGPNRIGQGIEFDYCCVHASFAAREEGYESIMVNSNPETVSTDYDTSDKLYFEPLTREDVLNICEQERPEGVIVQFGGQTPLALSAPLAAAGVPILGTQPDSIDLAEDRERFKAILDRLQLVQPDNGTAMTTEEAMDVARDIGYPVVVRPSYVLGGRAMKIVYDQKSLKGFTKEAIAASAGHPVLIDKFLEDAIEIDVDAISDGKETIICGVMEHIEEAGVHSGDSACVLPPHTLGKDILKQIRENTRAMAGELAVVGLMNVQYAVKDGKLFVLEVNPRASRTIPFVSKATGIPFARMATKVMLGRSLAELGLTQETIPDHVSVKESVLPFDRFPGVDTLLGPEMKSTGEVMGIDTSFGAAYAKSQLAAGQNLPTTGKVLISVRDRDKESICPIAEKLTRMGFEISATKGTSSYLTTRNTPNHQVKKVSEGRPHIVDHIKNGEVQLVINTSLGGGSARDGYHIRHAALECHVPYVTTVAGALAMVSGIEAISGHHKQLSIKSIQEYHARRLIIR
ncbi:MAG: carbamoyl-phosphate synthase large subunit [Deltaproteobacteria bacterium]|jgi:carbamoyl-phosphate synthase large subunit|nr:carbamoyl-phosphate synthase large subunit [Deltaproteobacteria bacterium]